MMIRASHFRALHFSTMSVPGISRRKYPMKKIPGPKPKRLGVKPRPLLISRLAYPTFTRSMNATINRTIKNGSRRLVILRLVIDSMLVGGGTFNGGFFIQISGYRDYSSIISAENSVFDATTA